jgi:hypothetical protein
LYNKSAHGALPGPPHIAVRRFEFYGCVADVAVQNTQKTALPQKASTAVVLPSVEAVTVDLTMPETVKETYLEVRDVITVIEILSPKNKRLGEGRNAYQKKRIQVLGSCTNLVEIDLLREGKPIQQVQYNLQSDYQILVIRVSKRPKADLYPFNLQIPIPSFALPLRETHIEPLLDIQL